MLEDYEDDGGGGSGENNALCTVYKEREREQLTIGPIGWWTDKRRVEQ